MTERVARLRDQSLSAKPYISTERAELVTKAYKDAPYVSPSIMRGYVFKTLMEEKAICINDGELIVGERGPAPKATPTYPEICCHSLEDLELLDSREKIPFAVSPDARKLYEDEIIPFWKNKSMREMIFSEMADEWKAAYEAGVFTEFMEQRSPGHTVLDDKIYKKGLLDFKRDIQKSLACLDYINDNRAWDKREQLIAMDLCADGLIRFAERHANKVLELAKNEQDKKRKAELIKIAEICMRVPAHAPRTFWEALQAYWFVHIGVVTEYNTWDSFNPGHLDQHLYPFYKKDIEEGRLTREKARELLQCFWIKFNNQPAPPKVGVTAEESATYTDFANINMGGLTKDGSDAVNDLTFLILDVIDEMRLLQPSSNLQLSAKNPDRFLKRALRIIRKGWGQPSIFNADMVIQELLRQGKSIEDARCGGTSGCIETGAFGKESYILTGYFNLPKVLELSLNNGIDARTGIRLGPATGCPEEFKSFDDVLKAFERQLNYLIDVKIKGNNIIERMYAKYMPSPFLSLLIDDCIEKGMDYHEGGARYNTTYIQGVGIGTSTDSLAAIRHHVFNKKSLTMDMLIQSLKCDFEGYENIRLQLANSSPKYGNDDPEADDLMVWIFRTFFNSVDSHPNTKGGVHRINMLPTTCHVYFGKMCRATPDGRNSGKPLSEGISPVQGKDRNGPTSVMKSAAKMDHALTGGTLLNMKFTPKLLEGEEGIENLAHLVRTYFKLGGHHVQFNVISRETLEAAQDNPEEYKNLIVRVAGYSDYFCDLGKALQDEIIARTEHTSF
ncbi:MAG: glycyl radical protein [Firmicutes bacterium]|jgi:pyruvate formate-lyase/glycerol dehydratase family glycyl radical enzyme|nr:glycyl radical protein [Bacillota bacterium]